MADQNLAPTYGNVDAFNLKSIETGGVINEDVMQKIFDISASHCRSLTWWAQRSTRTSASTGYSTS